MQHSTRTTSSCLFFFLLAASQARSQTTQDDAAPYDRYGQSSAVGDFDGDGVGDLAVGIPGEDLGSRKDAGAVRVHYSLSGGGPGTKFHQYLNEALLGFQARGYESFGHSLVAANFNGDAYDDLAIGAYGEDVGSKHQAGAVFVIHGGPAGLDLTQVKRWHQGSAGIAGAVETGDWFGFSLASADFDGNLFPDLAIGVPLEDIGSIQNAGAVNVIYGFAGGLQSSNNSVWYQDVGGVNDVSEAHDQYGHSLATGDFDGNGLADLAIGVPYEDQAFYETSGTVHNIGLINILHGSPVQGIRSSGDVTLFPVTQFGQANLAAGAAFGYALAAGRYELGKPDFLAVGAPYQKVGSVNSAGRVHILQRVSGSSYSLWNYDTWDQASPGIAGGPEYGDGFGTSLAVGEFSISGAPALVVGVPGEALGSLSKSGVVQVLYFDTNTKKIGANGSQMWHQNSAGIPGGASPYDSFGRSVTVGDVTGEGFEDLVIGVPGEDTGGHESAGAVHVLRGGGLEGFDGVTAIATQLLHEFFWAIGGGTQG